MAGEKAEGFDLYRNGTATIHLFQRGISVSVARDCLQSRASCTKKLFKTNALSGTFLRLRHADKRDSNFQGYGRFLTDVKGNYYFRTVKPVAYPGRTPHIHLAVSQNGKRIFTTQILIKGEKQNAQDGLFRNIRDEAARQTVLADFKKIPHSKIGELAANFDVVLGVTVEDPHDDAIKGGIGKPEFRGGPGRGPRPPRS